MNTLVVLPRLALKGGVSHYYSTLRPHLNAEIGYYEVGKIDSGSRGAGFMKRLVRDYTNYYRAISNCDIRLVVINPSFGYKSLIRDGVFLQIAKFKGKKVITFFRGANPKSEKYLKGVLGGLFRSIYGRSDTFIVLSKEYRDMLLQIGLNKQFYLETTVVPQEVFDNESVITKDSSLESGHQINVLIMSRLVEGKGLDTAIKAFGVLQKYKKNARLVVAGEGGERAKLQSLVAGLQLKNTSFVGHVSGETKKEVFRNSNVFLFCSEWEGMPNVVLEAMAYGLAIVTTSVGGLVDFFEDRKMGRILDSRDPDDFSEAILSIFEPNNGGETISNIAVNNYWFAEKQFSASVVAARLESIIENNISLQS